MEQPAQEGWLWGAAVSRLSVCRAGRGARGGAGAAQPAHGAPPAAGHGAHCRAGHLLHRAPAAAGPAGPCPGLLLQHQRPAALPRLRRGESFWAVSVDGFSLCLPLPEGESFGSRDVSLFLEQHLESFGLFDSADKLGGGYSNFFNVVLY